MPLRPRCEWAKHPEEIAYHDAEWGVPVFEDRVLFEFLTLEGAQAGLSWLTVLKKRQGYHEAFHHFDLAKVAEMSDDELEHVLVSGTIVRNRLKVFSTRQNARLILEMKSEFPAFADYWWHWSNDAPITNHWQHLSELPARTDLSDRISLDLKKRGFKFVGSTIIYAMMQATGMVNDHTAHCFRHADCSGLGPR